jgi:hypothetical protein
VQLQASYLDIADKVAEEMKLESKVREIEDLGPLDTFSFEERSFLNFFVKSALEGKLSLANAIAAGRKGSVWVRNTDRQSLWTIGERAVALVMKAEDLATEFSTVSHSWVQSSIFCVARGYWLDTLHREFERSGWRRIWGSRLPRRSSRACSRDLPENRRASARSFHQRGS